MYVHVHVYKYMFNETSIHSRDCISVPMFAKQHMNQGTDVAYKKWTEQKIGEKSSNFQSSKIKNKLRTDEPHF